MKTYTFFQKLKLKIHRFIERLKFDRSKIDRMGENVTMSMKNNGAWVTGAKRRNSPIPYPPFDRSPNTRSKRGISLKKP
ncbi:MAG: hypothetical protein ACTSRE_09545 [Promethearchaeota archaeon]